MSDRHPPIYFYIPEADLPEALPESAENYWLGFRQGVFAWTLQTYLHLKKDGFPCKLVGSIPTDGIAIAHWDSLPLNFQPGAKLLLVCLQADRGRHPYAQIHVVQNIKGTQNQIMLLGDKYLLPGGKYYIPHWPQPGLIPRNPARGDRFENVAFFGLEENLAPEFKDLSWHELLKELGLNWFVVSDFERWNDYSEVDVIIAVRSFDGRDYTWKPATKLYNAWHAGVPVILGRESAYISERKSELDYLEVRSINDVVKALKKLQKDEQLRFQMIENGKLRARETQKEQLVLQWRKLIEEKIIPEYEIWRCSLWYRFFFIKRRQWAMQTRELRKKLQKVRNNIGLRTRLRSLINS